LNARSYALISVFAALAIVLNIFKIPVFYWPGFSYTICEIPVLVAFLIYGFKLGFLVEAIHIIGQEIFFPAGMTGLVIYPLGFLVHLFLFFGMYLANELIKRKIAKGNEVSEKKRTIFFTGLATALRGGLMPIFDYAVLYSILLPIALGYAIPQPYILALVPAFILYNITSTLYAVPIAYVIARKVSIHLKINPKYLSK
jgi:riboflavin transporter FmnP